MNGTSGPPDRPTRYRYGVLTFACSLAAITYLDRLCFGSAVPHILKALNLSSVDELANAFAAFSLAYAVFEIPTGWLGDVYGPRKTLIRIVLWWSFFTAVTALVGVVPAFGLTALIAARFLFGIGEAGAFPNITRALHNWFPLTERGMAQGWLWMSGRLMGGFTPLVWIAITKWFGLSWQSAFVIFGAVGIAWCIAFALWFRNRPDEKPGVNAAELELIHRGTGDATAQAHANVPWGTLLKSRNLWAICVMYFLMSYGWYFNVNYLPTYLEEMHDVRNTVLADTVLSRLDLSDMAKEYAGDVLGALFKGGPLILGAAGCLLGGWLTDRMIRCTGNRVWGRRVFGMFGHAMCVPLYLFCIVAPSAWTFALALALAGFCNDLAMGSAWATCQDIGRRHAAIVAGFMNMIGNLGGFASSKVIGWVLLASRNRHLIDAGLDPAQYATLSAEQKRAALLPGYEWNFTSFAVLYGLAVVLWLMIDATKPVIPEDGHD